MSGIIEAPGDGRFERTSRVANSRVANSRVADSWVVELNVPGFRIVRWAQKRRHLLLGPPALAPHPAEAL